MKLPALLVAFSLLLPTFPLQAAPLKIELVSEVTSIQPGRSFHVALRLDHQRGYHTYWKFPGIVGVATHMDWKLPEGWKASEIKWPEPKQVFMFKIKAQGYHDEVFLPIEITPPNNLQPGGKITLQGKATWMCCSRECHPGFADLSLELPVSEMPMQEESCHASVIAQARAAQPRPLPGWKITARKEGPLVWLRLTPDSEAAKAHASKITQALFFTEDGFIHSDADQPFRREADGSLVLELPISEFAPKEHPKTLRGVVQTPSGWIAEASAKSATIAVDLE